MALVCKKHKRPEGQQVAHILTLKMHVLGYHLEYQGCALH